MTGFVRLLDNTLPPKNHNHPYIKGDTNGNQPWTLNPRFYQRKGVWLATFAIIIIAVLLTCLLTDVCKRTEQDQASNTTPLKGREKEDESAKLNKPATTRSYPNSLKIADIQSNITISTSSINRYWLPFALASSLLSVLLA